MPITSEPWAPGNAGLGHTVDLLYFRRLVFSAAVTAILLAQSWLSASPVRLSFLDENSSLGDTLQLLTNNACSKQAAIGYQHAVQSYVFDKSEFDLSRFPMPSKGFYSFATIGTLVVALPPNAFDSSHPATFNCFDTVILLADGQLR